MKKIITMFFALLCNIQYANALDLIEEWNILKGNVSKTWDCPDNLDLYVPLYAWHNRLTYDQEHVDSYNENPWGLGLGISRLDKDGDWHGLYAMGFKDSNKHLQTIFGYAYQDNMYFGEDKDWYIGAGFTLSLTQREEYYYIPAPLPLPMFGGGYKNFSIQAAYVPGGKNDGNVLFTWARVSF